MSQIYSDNLGAEDEHFACDSSHYAQSQINHWSLSAPHGKSKVMHKKRESRRMTGNDTHGPGLLHPVSGSIESLSRYLACSCF